MNARAASTPRTPTGTFTKKTQLQLIRSVRSPPTSGPIARARARRRRPLELVLEILSRPDTLHRHTDQAAQRLCQTKLLRRVAAIRLARPEIDRADHGVPVHDRYLDD